MILTPTCRLRAGLSSPVFDTEDNCEKALTDLQNSEQDPITLDKTGKLARLNKHDAALGKARAVNAACVASDDFRLKGKK